MTTKLQQRYHIKTAAFGARGCSCSCKPCDCDPCTCGDEVRPPLWRVSGYHIQSGTLDGSDVSGLFLLSLAQPSEKDNTTWQETLLVDENATQEQISILLNIFEDQLESFPAEVEQRISARRAIYTVPMRYTLEKGENQLHVDFVPRATHLLREGISAVPQPWSYHGPMAQREQFVLSSS